MSQENVDLVRWIYAAVARRDGVSPFEVYAEDIVWDISQMEQSRLLAQPVFHGHEGVRQFWRETVAAFGEVDFEVEEVIDAGDRVLAVIRETLVGRASGAPVGKGHLALWTLSGGKVIRMQTFDDRLQALEALEAVGLSD